MKDNELNLEQLDQVTGGNDEDFTSTYSEVTVRDGENRSALCPFCSSSDGSSVVVLAYDGWWQMRYGPSAYPENYNHFHCQICNRKFIKDSHGKWLVK